MSLPITTPGYNLVTAVDAAAQRALLQLQGTVFATPIVVTFKNVTVLTSATPDDVASITLPSWLTRWRFAPSGGALCVAESAAGTLAGASFSIFGASGGSGSSLVSSFAGPASTSVVVLPNASGTSTLTSAASTIYLRQTANSANSGVISVYLTILPCL